MVCVFAGYVEGPRDVHLGTRALGMESALGRYGLMSMIGVFSKASSPLTVKLHPSTFTSSTTQSPIGLGLDGLLQAKTPVCTCSACRLGYTSKTFLCSGSSR